uniref:uncharacterized protein LOC130489925 n=1 Tax=Euleptes europaea TaxID=460621 RepID=UPI0025404A31|nr:uncharacterized protein LOC130489925 [Euleptes europaea]
MDGNSSATSLQPPVSPEVDENSSALSSDQIRGRPHEEDMTVWMTLFRVLSEIQLTQSGLGTAKPGESLRLTCTVSGASITDGYAHHWIRQPPNKGLEWIGRRYYSSSTWHTDYASAFRSRVSISPDSSKNEFSLQLSSLTAADTAVYYCARDTQGSLWRVDNWKSLRLTCTVSGASITDGYGYSWIRQLPSKALEWIGWRYYSSSTWHTNYASAFQSRMSISPDSSKNEFSLQLNSLTAADTAIYYCARGAQ